MKARQTSVVMSLILLAGILGMVSAPAGDVGGGPESPGMDQVTLLRGARAITDEPAERIYYVSASGDAGQMETLYERLVRVDARHIDVFYPDVIVCEVPLRANPWGVLEGTDFTARTQESVSRSPEGSLPYALETARRTFERADANRQWELSGEASERQVDVPRGVHTAIPSEGPVSGVAQTGGWRSAGADDDRLYYQNTEFLAGRVHINIVFMQGESESPWTARAKQDAEVLVGATGDWFRQQLPNSELAFSRRSFKVETPFTPINTAIHDPIAVEELVDDVMDRLNPKYYGDTELILERVGQLNNDSRATMGNPAPDWVFTLFLANSAEDADHRFNSVRADMYAVLGGPFCVLPFPAGPAANPETFEQWFKHCVITMFWALKEDYSGGSGCDRRSGYLNFEHGNKIQFADPPPPITCKRQFPMPCIAWYGSLFYFPPPAMCDYTLGMVGASDENGNNVPDVFDAAPSVVFQGAAIETLLTLSDPIRFSVHAEAVPNHNSQQTTGPRRSYACPIKDVEYLITGVDSTGGTIPGSINPVKVDPIDGKIDEPVEEFAVMSTTLFPGDNKIAVSTRNTYGAKLNPPATKRVFYVGVFYDNLAIEQKNEGVQFAWNVVLGPFKTDGPDKNVDFDLFRVDYDADSAVTLIATDAELTVGEPTEAGYTPYYYLDPTVMPGSNYGYFVQGTVEILYRGEMTEFESSSSVIHTVAPLARLGMMSMPAPNPFIPAMRDRPVLVSIEVPEAVVPSVITTELPSATGLTVGVYDVAGRRIKQLFDQGVFVHVVSVEWDGTDSDGKPVPTGVYFIAARVGDVVEARKVLVLR